MFSKEKIAIKFECKEVDTKIIIPPNTSDNCKFEFNQLLMYAPISSEYRKLKETAIKSENK